MAPARGLPLTQVAFLNIRKAEGSPDLSGGMRAFKLSDIRAMKRAAEAIEPIWALAYAFHKLDHWPNQAEYAEFWELTERQAQREWAAFRRGFPTEQSPERLARALYAQVGRRIENKAAVLSEPAPAELQPA